MKLIIVTLIALMSTQALCADFTVNFQPDATTLAATVAAASPVGTISMFGGSTAPAGWLLADGTSLLRTDYPALFAAIGVTYGSVDATHFTLPNTKGVFVRGAGSQIISGITYAGAQGTTQADQIQGHAHALTDPGHSHVGEYLRSSSGPDTGYYGSTGTRGSITTFGAYTGITINSPTSDGTNGTPRTGIETRPANVAVQYMIKAN